jgi:aarF domain-containing kinase
MNLESVATCPFVYKELSSRRVLTLEKFDGVPLTDLEAIKQVQKTISFEHHAALAGCIASLIFCWGNTIDPT